jgi:hypothetical protein
VEAADSVAGEECPVEAGQAEVGDAIKNLKFETKNRVEIINFDYSNKTQPSDFWLLVTED